jgi:hypothetical protein
MNHLARRFRALHPLQRLAVVAWVGLLVGVGGRVAFSAPRSQTVVPIYLNAADRWAKGEDLYAPAWPLDVYRNPPGVAAAFVPFTWVPEKVAGLAWRGLGAAVFLIGLTGWVRRGLPRPLTAGETGAVFALAAPLALSSLNNGQTNLVVIGLLLLGATAAARQRWRSAGLWLALGGVVKLYPLAAGLLLAAAFPRRLLPWLTGFVALFLAIPFALQDPNYVINQYRSFVSYVGVDARALGPLDRAPRDLFMLLRVWFAPPPVAVYQAVQLGAAALMAGLVVYAARRTRDPRFVAPLALNLGCVWMTVLGPASEPHTYAILGPTAAAAVVLGFASRTRPAFWLGVLGYGLLAAPVVRDMFPNGWRFQVLGPHPVGGLLVLVAVVIDALARLTAKPEPPRAVVTGPERVVLLGEESPARAGVGGDMIRA